MCLKDSKKNNKISIFVQQHLFICSCLFWGTFLYWNLVL